MGAMKIISLWAITCFVWVACYTATAAAPVKAELVSARKIWDQAPYNSFTDLARFKDNWFCVFREGTAHVSPDGAIRIIKSADGERWESAARLELPGSDLRDPKIDVAANGQLMIVGGATVREGSKPATASQSFVTFSPDGMTWGKLQWAAPTNQWLWRVTWHESKAYGVAYDVSPENRAARKYGTRLLQSSDGAHYTTLVPTLYDLNGPTEATLRFARDGTLHCLQRRDGKPSNSALLGTSQPPYADWQWRDLGQYFGGPNFIQLPDGRWLAAGRLMEDKQYKTVVCELDVAQGKLKPVLTLPSGGDNSYPGLVWHGGLLWVSYYSSHEGKTSVYLARVKILP